MRVIVFFDLPMKDGKDISEYNKFRRKLITEGFIMLQESVYCKLALNLSVVNSIKNKVEKIAPKKGDIQILSITEKQFNQMQHINGRASSTKIDSTDRIVVI